MRKAVKDITLILMSVMYISTLTAGDNWNLINKMNELDVPEVAVNIDSIKNFKPVTSEQYLALMKLESSKLFEEFIEIKGLKNPEAPTKYVVRLDYFAGALDDEISYLSKTVEFGVSDRIFIRLMNVKRYAYIIRKIADSISGSSYYEYWKGPEVKKSADRFDELAKGLEKTIPDLYAFVKPELKNYELKKEWEEFVKERIEKVNKAADLYVKNNLGYMEFAVIVENQKELKERWEEYQETTLR